MPIIFVGFLSRVNGNYEANIPEFIGERFVYKYHDKYRLWCHKVMCYNIRDIVKNNNSKCFWRKERRNVCIVVENNRKYVPCSFSLSTLAENVAK